MDIRQISKRFSFIKNMKPENREYLLDRLRMKKIPKGFIMVGDQGLQRCSSCRQRHFATV